MSEEQARRGPASMPTCHDDRTDIFNEGAVVRVVASARVTATAGLGKDAERREFCFPRLFLLIQRGRSIFN